MNSIRNFFTPITQDLVDFIDLLPKGSLGKKIQLNKEHSTFDFSEFSIVVFGIAEDKNATNNIGTGNDLSSFRMKFYKLFAGNWNTSVYDLGDFKIGKTYQDTDIALQEVTSYLIKRKLFPVIIGGSQALTSSLYRAYDKQEQQVNLTVVDSKFDLGSFNETVDSQSYLTKIVMEKPNNLLNFTNIGYQTFLNSQEEINLIDTLLFDSYRLGEVKNGIELIEPSLRVTDILSIDIGAVRKLDAPANANATISGFNADDICKITRYAGLSDQLKVLGIFEYNNIYDKDSQTAGLIAQMIWYFVEGINYRTYEFPTNNLDGFTKYMVIIAEDTYNFYKSNQSDRWWMEIFINKDNKTKRRTLVPCTYKDYLTATKEEIPKRWYMNRKKFN